MDISSYIVVTFDDGSYNEYPVDKWFYILDHIRDRVGRPICEVESIYGEPTAFFSSKVQDMHVVTPESRQRARELKAFIKEERAAQGYFDD